MNERFTQIEEKLSSSLEKISTALLNKKVNPEYLRVSDIADKIREIELSKYVLVTCPEFTTGILTATIDETVKTTNINEGKATLKLNKVGKWHIEAESGDYTEVTIQEGKLNYNVELKKKKVTFSEGQCGKNKIIIHIDSVVGQNSKESIIQVKKNGKVITADWQLVGSDIEITNFEYQFGAIYTVENLINGEVRGSIQIEIKIPSVIYGVKIIESESNPTNRVIYTDKADGMTPVKVNLEDGSVDYYTWKDSWIFKKIYPAMINTDGTIAYRLDPEDQTQKVEGGASEVANLDFDGNAMVVVEKFYTKFSMDGENECIQISDEMNEGFEAIGFIREDGSEADYICLPMFMGSFDSSSKLRSISGQDIKYSTSFNNFRTAAQKNGTSYDIEVYAMNEILMALYLILFKTCDWRNTLGEGRTYKQSKTGVLANKGAIAFDPTSKAVKFLYVEDFVSWPRSGAGMQRYEAGIVQTNNELYVKLKPHYSGSDTNGYIKVPDYIPMDLLYISKMKCSNEYGRCPLAGNGAENTYEATRWDSSDYAFADRIFISKRGESTSNAGRNIISVATTYYSNTGAALSLIPPA